MKKMLFSLATILTLGLASASFAHPTASSLPSLEEHDSFQSKVLVRPERMKLDVLVASAEKNEVTVSLLDNQGRTLARGQVNTGKSTEGVRFDVSNLKDGAYRVVISDGATRRVEDIELTTVQPRRTLSLQ